MTQRLLSDGELANIDRAAYRARFRWVAYAFVYGLALSVLLIVAVKHGWISRDWIDASPLLHISLLTVPFMLPLLPFIIRAMQVPKEARAPRVQGILVEDNQRRRRLGLWIVLFVVPYDAAIATWNALSKPFAGADQWIVIGIFVTMIMITLITLLQTPKDGDEISRAIRAAAAKIGFVAGLMLFAGIYLLALIRPDWVTILAPAALATATCIPAAYYLFADWRAGREG